MCAHCRHALLTCMIVSSDPLPNAPGPELPFTSKCSNAEPPPWGRPRGAFTSVITSPEPSAGCYALELYVRYALHDRRITRRASAHHGARPELSIPNPSSTSWATSRMGCSSTPQRPLYMRTRN